jgi:deoxyribodipyrimidine photo-lyase
MAKNDVFLCIQQFPSLMKSKRIIVWFRNDLRLHDNEMLVEAIAKSDEILPVYFFDPRHCNEEQPNKAGLIHAGFLKESVQALRIALQELGGDILIIAGKPEEHMSELVEQYEISEVYHHREVAAAETQISANVEDRLWKIKVNLKHFIGHTLYNKEDLPFPIKDIPDVFTQFKKKTERDATVKPCIVRPQQINFVAAEEWGMLPDFSPAPGLTGGEQAGLAHLSDILSAGSPIYQKPALKTADRNGYSSRLSAWLSLGCLSPRQVYWSVKEAETRFGSNANFTHLLVGLLWRDYYRFMFKKHGAGFLEVSMLPSELTAVEAEENLFEKWKSGKTGHPLIDSYMEQLNTTGYIPHTARILVSTFLVHLLHVNWRKGASYFEERLVDYSTASNWGNWASIAEGDKNIKSKHTFDVDKQVKFLNSAALI